MKVMRAAIVCVSLASLVVGCDFVGLSPGPTPSLEGYGSTPVMPRPLMPDRLDCTVIPSVSRGIRWDEFQIGVTTFDQFLEVHEPATVYWDRDIGNVVFENEGSIRRSGYLIRYACFIGNRLSAFSTYPDEGMEYLEDWIEEYGAPDRVTWTNANVLRSVIWAEEGILIIVDVRFNMVEKILLLPPIPADELEGSWLLEALPQGPIQVEIDPDEIIDSAPLSPEENVEDPWGYDQQ